MTKTQIYTLLTSILGGNALDTTLFDTLLEMSKNTRESERDWMVLRTLDSTITFTAADTYATTKTLPSRFLRIYRPTWQNQNDTGVYLVDANGGRQVLQPISLAQRYEYKDTTGFYYLDHKNGAIGRTGTNAGTLHLNFIQGTDVISDTLEWVFPSYASTLLAFDIAIMQKGGIDWDVVASFSVPYNQQTIKTLESNLALWDARLQQQEIGV